MEKLQQALQKAREQRGDAPLQPGPRPSAASAASAAREDAWQAIPTWSIDTPTLERSRIVTTRASHSSMPFDILRTKVVLAMRKNGWKRLAITSPTANCGKTTTACNLALGFSRQQDLRAILFELDLRRPSIARQLKLPEAPDITEMLAGRIDFADQAQRYSNIAISAARQRSADPAEVLLSQTTHNTLARVEATYRPDLAIFDLPPLLVSEDTRAFLKDVDCALIVARAEVTTVAQIDACEREIAEHTNVLGVALNQCRHVDESHGDYKAYASGA